jgi:hypothetical protein
MILALNLNGLSALIFKHIYYCACKNNIHVLFGLLVFGFKVSHVICFMFFIKDKNI